MIIYVRQSAGRNVKREELHQLRLAALGALLLYVTLVFTVFTALYTPIDIELTFLILLTDMCPAAHTHLHTAPDTRIPNTLTKAQDWNPRSDSKTLTHVTRYY